MKTNENTSVSKPIFWDLDAGVMIFETHDAALNVMRYLRRQFQVLYSVNWENIFTYLYMDTPENAYGAYWLEDSVFSIEELDNGTYILILGKPIAV